MPFQKQLLVIVIRSLWGIFGEPYGVNLEQNYSLALRITLKHTDKHRQ